MSAETTDDKAVRKSFILYPEDLDYLQRLTERWRTRSEGATLRRIIQEHAEMSERLGREKN